MILYAADDWREPSFIDGLYEEPNGNWYAMIEITLFVPLFFVDVLCADEPDDSRWRQFLLPNFRSVTDFLSNLREKVEDAEYEVSILVPANRTPGHERVVGAVVEVQEGVDREHGALAVVYTLADGRRILDAHVARSEKELGKLKTIYRKEKYVRPREHDEDLT